MTKPKLSKLRIDYFNDFPLTLEGAESIHVYEICNNLQLNGCDITLFTPKSNTRLTAKFTIVPIWSPSFLISIFYQLLLISKLVYRYRKDKPDAIYLRVTPLLILPVIAAKIYKIPVFAEINGTLHKEIEDAHKGFLRQRVYVSISDAVECVVYKTASRIITVTESIKEYLVLQFKINPAKITVIENGVDTDMLKPINSSRTSNEITLGYVGSLMSWQGLSYLIDAMKYVSNANVNLVIAGDGPERAALVTQVEKAYLSQRVTFLGKINHAKVSKVINSFDICIAYYVKAREGLNSPFKVYEYLSCGKPTIVSDIKGSGDTFLNVTKVVTAENSYALADAINELVLDRKLRTSLGKKAREFVVMGHTWRDVSKILADEIAMTINQTKVL